MRSIRVTKLSQGVLLCLSAAALLPACGGGKSTTTGPQMAAASVTPEHGGTVVLPDSSAALVIPPGAVGSTTMITVSTATSAAPPPAGTTAVSPVLKFEPDGLVFAKPVLVTFNFRAGAQHPSVYWSNATGGYDAIGGTVSGSTIAAEVTHFSSGFVGDVAACAEGGSCTTGASCAIA